MARKLIAVITVMALMSVMGACTPPTGDAPQRGEKKAAPAPKPAPAAPPQAEKKTAAKPEQKQTVKPEQQAPPTPKPLPEIIVNGSFEDWRSGVPHSWNVREGQGDKWVTVQAKKTTGSKEGSVAVELPLPAKDNLAVLSQTIAAHRIKTGRKLTLSAVLKAPKEEELHAVVSYKVGGKEVKERVYTSGSGAWEKLENTFEVPANADPASFRISLIRRPLSDGAALVEMVSLK